MEKTDKELICEFQNGAQEALDVLFERYKNRIFNFCLRILNNRADAEDVTSEVFLKLFTKSYKLDSNAKFSTWLFTIARNTCLTKIQKGRKILPLWIKSEQRGGETQLDVEDPAESIDEGMMKKEAKIYVKIAIRKLPHHQKEALVLREYHKMSYEEISLILGCSLEKVKILIFRARDSLRIQLAPLIKGDSNE